MKIQNKIGLTIILIGATPAVFDFLNVYAGMSSTFNKLPKSLEIILVFGNLLASSFIMFIGAIILMFEENKIWFKLLSILIILFSIFWQYSMCKVEL